MQEMLSKMQQKLKENSTYPLPVEPNPRDSIINV